MYEGPTEDEILRDIASLTKVLSIPGQPAVEIRLAELLLKLSIKHARDIGLTKAEIEQAKQFGKPT